MIVLQQCCVENVADHLGREREGGAIGVYKEDAAL